MFAWHGSRLANWHSIIRTGLDFLEPLNGRAYGHGVYHSQDLNTSLGYSSNHHGYTQNVSGISAFTDTTDLLKASATWAGSEIEIRQAICLNEIVNKPEKFVSSNPHLVVQHVDWIQCRYLFVKTNADDPAAAALRKPDHANLMIQQDERFHVRGSDGKPVEIPLGVLPASRGFRSKGQSRSENTPDVKKLKIDQSPSCAISDAINDQETDDEDLIFLCSDDEEEVFGDPHSQRLVLPIAPSFTFFFHSFFLPALMYPTHILTSFQKAR
jgi:ubiquitin-conjugating enzyme E2 Q